MYSIQLLISLIVFFLPNVVNVASPGHPVRCTWSNCGKVVEAKDEIRHNDAHMFGCGPHYINYLIC